MRLNSRSSIEGLPVSSLNCDRPLGITLRNKCHNVIIIKKSCCFSTEYSKLHLGR